VAGQSQGSDKNAYSVDFLLERKLGAAGAFSVEAEWAKYDHLGGYSAQYGTDLYRINNDQQAPTMKTFYPESCGAIAEHVRAVPFVGNAALIFMNAPGMAHGASIPRDATQATRYAYQFYVGPPKDEYGRLIRRMTPAQQAAYGAAGAAETEEGY